MDSDRIGEELSDKELSEVSCPTGVVVEGSNNRKKPKPEPEKYYFLQFWGIS